MSDLDHLDFLRRSLDPADQVLRLARTRGWRLGTAESCTGGMIAAALTAIPGSSDVVVGGLVTYSNAAKIGLLGVKAETLDTFGAVSEAVAQEMAQGVIDRLDVDVSISVTGIAGPGGSDFKPEGRVCFGLSCPRGIRVQTCEFGALGRDAVRTASVMHALSELALMLKP